MPLIPQQEPPYYQIEDTTPQGSVKYQYTALLTQTGTSNPTAQILYNSLGTITWTRDATGVYKGTLSGAFDTNKTAITIGQNNTGKTGIAYANLVNLGEVGINTIDLTPANTDELLKDTVIDIKIYN